MLDRSVNDQHSKAQRPAPLLSEMLRRKVYEELGRQKKGNRAHILSIYLCSEIQQTILAGRFIGQFRQPDLYMRFQEDDLVENF